MMSIGRETKPSASAFLAQLAALGFFSRIVLILAILALLSLNDYFTTQSQIASLLPVSALIILLLVLVAVTDTISGRMIQALIKRFTTPKTVLSFFLEAWFRIPNRVQMRNNGTIYVRSFCHL